jgi:hypothetical protein
MQVWYLTNAKFKCVSLFSSLRDLSVHYGYQNCNTLYHQTYFAGILYKGDNYLHDN